MSNDKQRSAGLEKQISMVMSLGRPVDLTNHADMQPIARKVAGAYNYVEVAPGRFEKDSNGSA